MVQACPIPVAQLALVKHPQVPLQAWSVQQLQQRREQQQLPIDMLMESLNGDDEAKKHALDSLRGSVVLHAFDPQGCRALQLAFQVAETKVATQLLSELKGYVEAATRSPHANYVIQ